MSTIKTTNIQHPSAASPAIELTAAGGLWLGGGKILQVVRATDNTLRTTNSTTMVDASISVTITPQKSDSAILLMWTFYASPISTNSRPLQQQEITDSSNNKIAGTGGLTGYNPVVTETAYHTVTAVGWSTPATTNAVTYKGRFRSVDAATSARIENVTQTGQLFAIEVSA